MAIAMHCNLGPPDYVAVVRSCFGHICTQTGISELPMTKLHLRKIQRSRFKKRAIIWRSDDVFSCFFTVQIEDVQYIFTFDVFHL